MTDIAPELIEEIRTKFQTAMMKDRELNQALAAINNGSISCSDALTYADKIGAALQEAVGEVLSADVLPDGVMYYNIAERLVNEVYGDAFDLAEDASEQVMKSINDSAGIGLKVQASGSRKERLSEIIESIAGREYSGRTVTDFLSTTRSCPMNAAQDTFAANAEFQSSVGRSPKIVRTAHLGACEECIGLAGEHNYPGVSKRVFWRHGSCRCTVEYHPGDGTVQNAHTKQWTKEQTNAKINTRKLTEVGDDTAKAAARKDLGRDTSIPFDNDKFTIAEAKLTEYLLKPGGKHAADFFDVGYDSRDPKILLADIYDQFDQNNLIQDRENEYGKYYVTTMELGVTKTKSFKTVWIKERGTTVYRFVSAYRAGSNETV